MQGASTCNDNFCTTVVGHQFMLVIDILHKFSRLITKFKKIKRIILIIN